MKCYRKNGSDTAAATAHLGPCSPPSMKCYRKNGSDLIQRARPPNSLPSMKCYRKNGSDERFLVHDGDVHDPQ